MATIINNNITSNGNNNINTINNNSSIYENLIKEINILEKFCQDDLTEIKNACKENNHSKLLNGLKKLKQETLELIKTLKLKFLENLLTKII